MLAPWLLALVAAPPSFGPGLYRGEVLIPTGTVAVTLTLRGDVDDGHVDIPQQGLRRYPISDLYADGAALRFALPGQPGDPRFTLKYGESGFAGTFSQGGLSYDARLGRVSPAERVAEALRGVRPDLQRALTIDGSPGLAYGLVVDGYRTAAALGVHGVEDPAVVTPDTPFPLGTATRSFVAVAAAVHVETTDVDWNTPVASILPTFRLRRPDGGFGVTVEDLLAERVPFAPHAVLRAVLAGARPEIVLARIGGLPLKPKPGPGVQTSTDWPYVVLGQLLARPPGRTDGTRAIESTFLQTFALDATFDAPEGAAVPHTLRGAKVVPDVGPPEPLPASRGLWASARTVAIWLQMHLDGALLGPAGWARLERSDAGGWRTTHDRGHVLRRLESRSGGSSVMFLLAPDDRAGVAVLANRGETALADRVADFLMNRLLQLPPRHALAAAVADAQARPKPADPRPPRARKTRPGHRLSDYAGQYAHPAYGELAVDVAQKRLRVRLGPLEADLEHWHYETFASPGAAPSAWAAAPWTFVTDVSGEVVAVEVALEPQRAAIRFERHAR